jgi:nitroimidazol reductase NimA-like FMN-containing flavoprotein (pyridoxamine 5'-phosphate oxidase superfamily)
MTKPENPSDPPRQRAGHFETLPTDRCISLLSDTTTVGRVGFAGPSGQELLPVNFVYTDGSIYLATQEGSALAPLADGMADVAFEVDHIEALSQSGWSVVAKGHSERVDAIPGRQPRPWATGDRSLFVKIVPESITGRHVMQRR